MMWSLIVASALAQGAPAGAPSPAVPPAAAPPASTPPAADPPSLDEALGLGGAKKPTTDDQHAEDLKRSLEGAKPRDILASALDDMRRSEKLLEANEAGLPTRRVQESVVRKLDELIATAQRIQQQKNQQQQQGQQSGQQQKQGKGQQQGKQQANDGQRDEPREGGQERGGKDGKPKPQDAGGKRRPDGDANANEPPPNVDPTANDAQFDEGRAEWGRLPPRVREAVRQGMRDPMSSAYRRLTQDYYRRLAEEPKR